MAKRSGGKFLMCAAFTWGVVVLLFIVLWIQGMLFPLEWHRITADKNWAIVVQSQAGQVLVFYMSLREGRMDTGRTRFEGAAAPSFSLHWDNKKRDTYHRSIDVPLINPRGWYGHFPPFSSEGPFLSLPLPHGLVHVAFGQSPFGRRGIVHDNLTWIQIILPQWLILCLIGLLPGVLLVPRMLRLYRRSRLIGLCPTCGYDLRASPDRCPECGEKVPSLSCG